MALFSFVTSYATNGITEGHAGAPCFILLAPGLWRTYLAPSRVLRIGGETWPPCCLPKVLLWPQQLSSHLQALLLCLLGHKLSLILRAGTPSVAPISYALWLSVLSALQTTW